jgi:hypothetical protein
MKTSLILALAALLLSGCGPNESADAAAGDDPAPTRAAQPTSSSDETPSVLSVTGAESMDFDYAPRFSCIRDKATILTMTQSPRFAMYFPASVEPGTYELAEYDANADPAYVEGKAVVTFTGAVQRGSGSTYGNFYFKPVEGQVIIESMPSARGEYFVADLNATLDDGDGASVTLAGRLNIEETGSMSMDCQR